MPVSVYVDGAGGASAGFGFLVRETGETFYERRPGITSNQAEYLAVLAALRRFAGTDDDVAIYSDSRNTVSQLNHEFAINSAPLQELAREAWPLIAGFRSLRIEWVPRSANPAGKMLGS